MSSEWFSRPADERYLSLSDLFAAVRGRTERSRTRTVESAAIRVEANREDAERLTLMLPGSERPIAPTHWSFGQLAGLVGAPAPYLRQLPAPLAGINLQYGLTSHRAEQVKTLEIEDGRVELRAVTGPDYGRIFDHELVAAVQRIAGNGTGDTRWKVPGVLDWSTASTILASTSRRTRRRSTLPTATSSCSWSTISIRSRRAGCRTVRPTSSSVGSIVGIPRSAPRRSAWRASIFAPCARTAISGASRISRRSPSGTRNTPLRALRMRLRRR